MNIEKFQVDNKKSEVEKGCKVADTEAELSKKFRAWQEDQSLQESRQDQGQSAGWKQMWEMWLQV